MALIILTILYALGVAALIIIHVIVYEPGDKYSYRDFLFILLWPIAGLWFILFLLFDRKKV